MNKWCSKHVEDNKNWIKFWILLVTLHNHFTMQGRLRLKCDGTRAETRFRLSAKRTSPFKSAGASVQSTAGNRGVRISGSNAGYTLFRGSVKGTGYPLHSTVSPSLPLPCVTVCHHISTGLYKKTPTSQFLFQWVWSVRASWEWGEGGAFIGGLILRRTNQRLQHLDVCSHTSIADAAWREAVLIFVRSVKGRGSKEEGAHTSIADAAWREAVLIFVRSLKGRGSQEEGAHCSLEFVEM